MNMSNATNQLKLDNVTGWICGGGAGVNQGDAENGTIAARVINLDRQLTGADNFPSSIAGRIVNIDRQLTGADGQAVNLVQHVIDLKAQVSAQAEQIKQLKAVIDRIATKVGA